MWLLLPVKIIYDTLTGFILNGSAWKNLDAGICFHYSITSSPAYLSPSLDETLVICHWDFFPLMANYLQGVQR